MNNTNKTPQQLAEEKKAQEAVQAKTETKTETKVENGDKPPVTEPKKD
jgi:hypothetical protein